MPGGCTSTPYAYVVYISYVNILLLSDKWSSGGVAGQPDGPAAGGDGAGEHGTGWPDQLLTINWKSNAYREAR